MKQFVKDKITLLHCDCLDYMKDVPDKHFDLAIVDPPYGIGNYWMKQKHTQHYGKKEWNNKPPDKKYFDELFRISKNQIIWGGNYFCHFLPITNSWIIWDKGNDVEKMNTSECEIAWTSFKIPMRKIFIQWSGGRKNIETGISNIHPCQRPKNLYKWLLKNYATPDMKIIDTHGGSMSSMIACHDFGCEAVCCEIDEEYFDAAVKRFDNETRQLTCF